MFAGLSKNAFELILILFVLVIVAVTIYFMQITRQNRIIYQHIKRIEDIMQKQADREEENND